MQPNNTIDQGQAGKLALAFCAILAEHLKPWQLAQVIERNRTEPEASVCHSHDFIDANCTMNAAWCHVMGRSIDLRSATDCTLWSEAWRIAKAHGLLMSRKTIPVTDLKRGQLLIRCNFPVRVLEVTRATMPLGMPVRDVLRVRHEKATVHYPLANKVEIVELLPLKTYRVDTEVSNYTGHLRTPSTFTDWYDAHSEAEALETWEENCHRYGLPMDKTMKTIREATERERAAIV